MSNQRIPPNMSPHHPMYSQQYQVPRQQLPQRPPQQYQQRPQQPHQAQYRERNIPQVQYSRDQPAIQPNPYNRDINHNSHSGQVRREQNFNGSGTPSSHSGEISRTPTDLPSPPGTKGQYLLYYSNYCINSKEFLNILCKTKYYNMFIKINISQPEAPRPSFLKFIPTIIVPEANRPLIGEEVFKWLEIQSENNKIQSENQGDVNDGEIKPFLPLEMGGAMSDSYSYLDVDPSSQPMEHSFSFLGKPIEKINTPQESEFGDNKSRRADLSMDSRPPLPQGMTQSNIPPGMAQPSIPQSTSSNEDKESVDRAFQDLMERRNMEYPQQQRQDI